MKPWKQVFILVLASGALIDATAGTIRGLRLREKLLVDLLRNAPWAGCYVVRLLAANSDSKRHAVAMISATLYDQATHT